jgi:hypothetical protein
MATGTGSLADAFASSGIKETTPEQTNDNSTGGEQQIDLVIPPIPQPGDGIPFITGEEKPDPVVTDAPVGSEPTDEPIDQPNYFQQFAEAIGIEGEVTGSSFEDLIELGKKATSQYKEQLEFYTGNPDLSGLAEHIKAGGNLQTFLQYPQETDNFLSVEFAEDDVTQREQLVEYFYENNGIDKEQAELLINNMKEKGTFNAYSDKVLEQFKAQEKAQNEQIVAQRKAEEETSIKQRNEFIEGVTEGFDKGLAGVTVDKEILAEARKVSLPDEKGQFGLHSIKLTPGQEAIVNTLIVALTKGKSFQYAPTKAAAAGGGVKPIHEIFNKQNNSGNNTQKLNSLEDMNKVFGNLKAK